MPEFLQYLYTPQIIAVLIGGILSTFIAFLTRNSKGQKTSECIFRGSLIAGILVIISTGISCYQFQKNEKILNAGTEKIAGILSTNTVPAIKNSKLDKQITGPMKDGDSYGYVMIFPSNKLNKAGLLFVTEGKGPLHDVKVRITNKEKMYQQVNAGMQSDGSPYGAFSDFLSIMNDAANNYKLGDVSPGSSYFLEDLNFPSDKNIAAYTIEIMTGNGKVIQDIVFRKIKGEWKRAEKIYFRNDVVKKYIDADFPRGIAI